MQTEVVMSAVNGNGDNSNYHYSNNSSSNNNNNNNTASRGGEAEVRGGTKRKHDSVAQNDYERFAKRFNLLNLDASTNASSSYYIPVPHPPPPSTSTTSPKPKAAPLATEDAEWMQVDETRDRVYIHDLDAEAADAELGNDEEKLIFLPDIEKHFSRVPQHVLTGKAEEEEEGRELVLYGVPKSLTVGDEGQDAVRKAILDARRRAGERAVAEAAWRESQCGQVMDEPIEVAHGYRMGYVTELPDDDEEEEEEANDGVDPDAMDMD